MTYSSLAVIGTAGRKEDANFLAHSHYVRMCEATVSLLTHLNTDAKSIKVFSGGAAWADHIVVTLALQDIFLPENVTLYLPAEITQEGYIDSPESSSKTADTANYYHGAFSKKVGYNTLYQILELGRRGATLIPVKGGFHARNTYVAKAVSPNGLLLACTFGSQTTIQTPWSIKRFQSTTLADQAGLKPGGSADCWNKCQAKEKWHLLIGKSS